MMVGVISYLPDSDKRAKRFDVSRTQIEWLHNLFTDTQIIVVAQNYNDNEYMQADYIRYIKLDKPIGAGKARNYILREFYRSNEDWLFICDDDTTAYPYYHFEDFVKELENNPNKFAMIDAISAMEPEYYAYKKNNYADKANLTHYKFTPRELNCGSATSFIKNISKYYNKEIYYPDIKADKCEGLEDVEFLLTWILNNLNWYKMNTWIRKSLAFNQSTIWDSDKDERNAVLSLNLDKVCERFIEYGIHRKVNGNVDWNTFNKLNNITQDVLYVDRETPIEFDEQTTPKLKITSKQLF